MRLSTYRLTRCRSFGRNNFGRSYSGAGVAGGRLLRRFRGCTDAIRCAIAFTTIGIQS